MLHPAAVPPHRHALARADGVAAVPSPTDDWNERQRAYWDALATQYDSLYRDRWSHLEDNVVVARLRRRLPSTTRAVLDLGCGTGLGATVIRRALGRAPEYHGLDISPRMLAVCQDRLPDAQLACGPMADLTRYGDNTFDAVTAFFASASYAPSSAKLLGSIARVLRPGGVSYLSFLNRYSLKRLAARGGGKVQPYNTRHVDRPDPPLVRMYSHGELLDAMADPAWTAMPPMGLGSLAGLVESRVAWPLSRALDGVAPRLSYLLDVVAVKQPN
jgi:ubiquinone/menaquinone biosynthesis C-methylase UbiE